MSWDLRAAPPSKCVGGAIGTENRAKRESNCVEEAELGWVKERKEEETKNPEAEKVHSTVRYSTKAAVGPQGGPPLRTCPRCPHAASDTGSRCYKFQWLELLRAKKGHAIMAGLECGRQAYAEVCRLDEGR